MNNAIGLCVSVLCVLSGAATLVWPTFVARLQEDDDTPPEQARREVLVGAWFLLLFGGALLYAVLSAGGQPVDPVLF